MVELEVTPGSLGVFDMGWTGSAHDLTFVDGGKITLAVLQCDAEAEPCGTCDVAGPIQNAAAGAGDIDNRRCTGNTSVRCNADTECAAVGGTCEFHLTTLVPLSSANVSLCFSNRVSGMLTGTVDLGSGALQIGGDLAWQAFLGSAGATPCPKCAGDTIPNDGVRGGSCDSGLNAGMSCDSNGTSPNPFFGSTSLDCPPSANPVGTIPVALMWSTDAVAKTLSSENPRCRAATSAFCLCDTCNSPGGLPCSRNADCPASGSCIGGANAGKPCRGDTACPDGTCGGRPCTGGSECASGVCTAGRCSTLQGICGGLSGQRCVGGTSEGAPCSTSTQCPGGSCSFAGVPTKPNECDNQICSPTATCVGGANAGADCTLASECPAGSCAAGNEGMCAAGPLEQFCGPAATFAPCTVDADCDLRLCVGGLNQGVACTVASQCPGGSCAATGQACNVAKFRNCFTDNGKLGASVAATGVPAPAVSGESSPTLAALFCAAPTSRGSINSVYGLPGLSRLEMPVRIRALR